VEAEVKGESASAGGLGDWEALGNMSEPVQDFAFSQILITYHINKHTGVRYVSCHWYEDIRFPGIRYAGWE
jgi:hypothetical protein